jgi:hypothetical protein
MKNVNVHHKIKNVNVHHKMKNVNVHHKMKNVNVHHKMKNVNVHHKMKNVNVHHYLFLSPPFGKILKAGFLVYFRIFVKRNPNTIPVSKIICTCTTIFLKFYNKCVNKNESGHHSSSC